MVQFISHNNGRYGELEGIGLALQGGCRWIQLRMKGAGKEQFFQSAVQARELCKQFSAKLILDDRVEAVLGSGADGVHLGKEDMPVREARRILGPDKIIGGTANSIEDIRRLVADGVDYIGLGPFRFTTTKSRLAPILGLDGYRRIAHQMAEEGIDIPIVAIGGISSGDIVDIQNCGPFGIALSGAVLNAEDPVAEMENIIRICK